MAAGVFWFLNLLKGEVPHGLSWEGVVPVEHIRGSCSHRGLVLSSEIHFLCLQSLSSLSAIPEPVTVVSFVIPNSFYRTSLYNGQLRPSRRLHNSCQIKPGTFNGVRRVLVVIGYIISTGPF